MRDLHGWLSDTRVALEAGSVTDAAGPARSIAIACDDEDVHSVDPEIFGPRFGEIDLQLHTAAAELAEAAEAGDLGLSRERYDTVAVACVACHAQAPSAGHVDLAALASPLSSSSSGSDTEGR